MKKINKRIISNLIMFMRRDVVSKGDEAIAYCECMDVLAEMMNCDDVDSVEKKDIALGS